MLLSRKLRKCFLVDDKAKARSTMAVSPKPALYVVMPSAEELDVALFGKFDRSAKGYDSGKVTGTGDVVVDGEDVFDIALRFSGLWNSRYESRSLVHMSAADTTRIDND